MKVRNVSLVAGITVSVFLSGMPLVSGGSIANYAQANVFVNPAKPYIKI